MIDYKEYGLEKLSEWILDCTDNETTSPEEIYQKIIGVLTENRDYFRKNEQKLNKILSLMKGETKWIVPVEVDDANDDYFITLPNDILKKVNWNENDQLEWINNGDGSWTIKKL